jgi:hypothetical protein
VSPTAAQVAQLLSPQSADVALALLTISGTGMDTVRLVNNTEDVVSNGETFSAFPFEVEIPSEQPDKPQRVTLRLCAVDRQLIAQIRAASGCPDVQLDVVLASDPDTSLRAPYQLKLRQAGYEALVVEAELGYEEILQEKWPKWIFTTSEWPGLHA